MGKIQLLSEDTVQRIAAGEVIERPASVVKELIENSLDAEATKITIEVEGAGKKLIRVKDNGIGMDRRDAELSLKRYATSKIKNFNDLFSLYSLGFRGEALPSIASVCRLSLLTKLRNDLVGTLIEAEDGKIKRIVDAASPGGTIITVRDLFFHTPPRKKFLKSDNIEFRHILNVVTKETLAHPLVSVQLFHNGRRIVSTPPRERIMEKIVDFWGKDFTSQLLPITAESSLFQLEGFICKPFFARRGQRMQYIFVNGRPISSRLIVSAVKEGYQPVIPEERYPQVFLFFRVEPANLDVNIHPTKNIIKFRQEEDFFSQIREAVTNTLKEAHLLPEIFLKGTGKKSKIATGTGTRRMKTGAQKIKPLEFDKQKPPKIKETEEGYTPPLFEESRIHLQINNTYLLGEDSEGLFLLDQHAVHERILYEKLKKGISSSTLRGQNLLIPETIELSKEEALLLTEHLEILKGLGFTIEPFGENTFIIHSIPGVIKKISPSVIILDILEEIEGFERKPLLEELIERILTVIACKSAVKAGDKLDRKEIESLVTQWQNTTYRDWCPHGRPAIIRFSYREIEKRFSRRE
ncbi:MAG TPA: DNA mismatch repair endonuclease MutL [Candidatus Omnitrophica bacterium]|nr:DNA mismatch repair endonuclease MutL [Candidatus Omnitrophota bacterium]